MNRAPADNALLASCEDVHRFTTLAAAFALFAAIGAGWFLLVAFKAGAL